MRNRSADLEAPAMAEMLGKTAETLEDFLTELDSAPAAQEADPAVLAALGTAPPEQPREFGELLPLVRDAAASGVDTAGPRYFGYIPGGGLASSAVGELLGRTFNRYTGFSELAPGLVALEDSVLRWMAALFALPEQAGGLLTTGGSQAVLSMVLAARESRFGEADFRRGRIYLSEQAHHCVRKAARVAGFPSTSLRLVPTSDGRRLDPDAAAQMIAADRAAGHVPFLLVASAGTTNSGSIDPLPELAALASREGLWWHVDACYGGFFQLTERGRDRMSGIERADSVSLDPHKSLFLPYGCGALLVREARALTAAHSEDDAEDYLQDVGDGGLPDYAARGTELTRETRGLRVWLPLQLHGVAAFRAALDEKLDLAARAHRALSEDDELEVPEAPELSTVVFRSRAGDAATRALLERINGSRRVFCSSTVLDGRVTLRLCVLSFRSHREHVDEAVAIIREASATVADGSV
ncbi:pyridoxal phosphate-dependent decarboxylase family protein [Salinifilum ghardaiensis]